MQVLLMQRVDQVMTCKPLKNVLKQVLINVTPFISHSHGLISLILDCTYPAGRFKDEVTEYYYGGDDNRHTPVSKPSFQNHLNKLDDRYDQPRPRGNLITL